jgi:alpha-galactosidase
MVAVLNPSGVLKQQQPWAKYTQDRRYYPFGEVRDLPNVQGKRCRIDGAPAKQNILHRDTIMPKSILDQTKITADSIQETQEGLLLSGAHVCLELPAAPKRFLYSGWQSWSLTAWVDIDRPVKALRPRIMHARETDPVYVEEKRPNGSWYGAVELADGRIVFLGALGLEAHVRLDQQTLTGWYESGYGDWLVLTGAEADIFSNYAQNLEKRLGKYRDESAYRVWCSWYSLYDEIDSGKLGKILNDLGDLPFDVFQIDDGWQKRVGNWEPNAKFPDGMQKLAAQIHATGRKAGIWMAPLLVSPDSDLYKEHREWLLHDANGRLVSAGYNWGSSVYALDTTHPGALDWLSTLMQKVRGWGFDYFKLDFLYGGALPGKRYRDIAREAAYREGLKVIREALGDAYLLACGSPILPSLGLCDGMRIGQDVGEYWDSRLFDDFLVNFGAPGVRNAIRNTINRLWLQPLVHTDPDVVFFHPRVNKLTPEQLGILQDLARIADFKATSDVPAWLTESERAALRKFLELNPRVERIGQAVYEIEGRRVDFNAAISMPDAPDPFTNIVGAILGGLANIPIVMQAFDAVNHQALKTALKKKLG